jgi:rhodanese-related sulfurtransferase
MKRIASIALLVLVGFIPVVGGNFYKNIKVSQAERIIREHEGKSDLIILDVRTSGEFDDGHIQGAINIDFWSKGFTDSIALLDKQKIYLVYCTSGVRSGGAMKKMRLAGFGKIYNMTGGMMGWRAAKKPLVKSEKNK